MTTEALLSNAITNRNATPKVKNSPGTGGPSSLRDVQAYVTCSASMAATSTYRMLEVPSACYVRAVIIKSVGLGAGAFDVGIYRTTDDGGAIAASGSEAFFGSAVSLASAAIGTDITNESTTNTMAKQSQPLWQAIGMASDPGGLLDFVLTVKTTDITTGGAVALRVSYVV
jgi:hypothetical protein